MKVFRNILAIVIFVVFVVLDFKRLKLSIILRIGAPVTSHEELCVAIVEVAMLRQGLGFYEIINGQTWEVEGVCAELSIRNGRFGRRFGGHDSSVGNPEV